MSDKIFAKGLRAFKPHEKSPSFVKASVVISVNELNDFIRANENHLTEYNGQKQMKLQLLENDKGLYFAVDTYKAKEKSPF